MAIDYDTLRHWPIPDIERTYTARDTILYALGLGFGQDPCDEEQLRFVLEDRLEALPSMALVLAYPPVWFSAPGTGVDFTRVVHAEMRFVNHRPLPAAATVVGKTRVTGLFDKGPKVGALMRTACEVYDRADDSLLCSLTSASMARGDGGFGGGDPQEKEVYFAPEGQPDAVCDIKTIPQAALIYRLSGDDNPLHSDPRRAHQAGFKQPILHGRCSFGIAAWALLKHCCGYQPARLKSMSLRFSSPVFPGETLRTEIWQEGGEVRFRTLVLERGNVALSHGKAQVLGPD